MSKKVSRAVIGAAAVATALIANLHTAAATAPVAKTDAAYAGSSSAAELRSPSPSAPASAKAIGISKQVSGSYMGAIPAHPGWTRITWTQSNTYGLSPATSAACTLYVGPVALPNGVNGNLEGETDQYCNGPFGVQQTQAHFDRTSWSGWRAYSNNYTSGLTRNTFLTTYFVVDCGGPGQGTYNYRLVARGYSTALGWSGWAGYSGSQSQRFACGT